MQRCLLAALLAVASAAAPPSDLLAFYLVYEAPTLTDIQLAGFHPQGNSFSYSIVSLPSTGSLVVPAQVYCDYQYTPKEGAVISTVPSTVTCDKPSVLYKYPGDTALPHGPLDRFTFRIVDTASQVSRTGIVHLLTSERLLAASNFNNGAEDWSISTNGGSSAVTYDPSSRGSMNRYITCVENWIDTNTRTGEDNELWYYSAPSKFLGDMAASYKGTLKFTLSSSSGDFSSGNLNARKDLVVLECATCITDSSNRAVKIYYNALKAGDAATMTPQWSFDGSTTDFSVPLDETKWRLDSENTNVVAVAPTQNEFIQVLARLSGIKILGDHTKSYESVALDSVKLQPSANRAPLPLDSYANLNVY